MTVWMYYGRAVLIRCKGQFSAMTDCRFREQFSSAEKDCDFLSMLIDVAETDNEWVSLNSLRGI